MYPKILNVIPLAGYQLQITFRNNVTKIYDCSDLLKHPSFVLLRDPAMFRAVQVDTSGYGVRWNDDLDLSESELWLHGQPVQTEEETDFEHIQQVKAQSTKRVTFDEVKQQLFA